MNRLAPQLVKKYAREGGNTGTMGTRLSNIIKIIYYS